LKVNAASCELGEVMPEPEGNMPRGWRLVMLAGYLEQKSFKEEAGLSRRQNQSVECGIQRKIEKSRGGSGRGRFGKRKKTEGEWGYLQVSRRRPE